MWSWQADAPAAPEAPAGKPCPAPPKHQHTTESQEQSVKRLYSEAMVKRVRMQAWVEEEHKKEVLAMLLPLLPGRTSLGAGDIWNGKISNRKGVPTYAAVFEGPKPFFLGVIVNSVGMTISIVPDSLQEIRATIQAAIQKL